MGVAPRCGTSSVCPRSVMLISSFGSGPYLKVSCMSVYCSDRMKVLSAAARAQGQLKSKRIVSVCFMMNQFVLVRYEIHSAKIYYTIRFRYSQRLVFHCSSMWQFELWRIGFPAKSAGPRVFGNSCFRALYTPLRSYLDRLSCHLEFVV